MRQNKLTKVAYAWFVFPMTPQPRSRSSRFNTSENQPRAFNEEGGTMAGSANSANQTSETRRRGEDDRERSPLWYLTRNLIVKEEEIQSPRRKLSERLGAYKIDTAVAAS